MSVVERSGTFALGDLHVRRLEFGAMQLSGRPAVFVLWRERLRFAEVR
jgi:hypothetical protein